MMSADFPAFRPLPFLANPHVQTVVGHFSGWVPNRLAALLTLVPLPDGDTVAIHENTAPGWATGGDCVLLLHGLGGCHRSKYLVRVTRRLLAAGFRVYRMDLRGAGATLTHCQKLYNAACSDDTRAAFDAVRAKNPTSRVFLVGFSLGGNISLKLAGEAADRPLPGLAGVATVAAPIDLVACSQLILRYSFYDRFYVRNLVRQVKAHARIHPHIVLPVWPRPMKLRHFDELYTAPRGGYASALEYYITASASPLVPRIDVPAFLLTARDDPFVAWQAYAELPPRLHQRIHVVNGGGHLGFLGPDGRGGLRWAETQIVDWLIAQSGR